MGGPAALEAVFPVLEALAKTQSEAEQEREKPEEKANEDVEKEKVSENTEAEKSEEMDVKKSDEEKADSDFEVIPASSPRSSSIYPTLPTEEQARLWKTNPMDSTNTNQEGTESESVMTNADKKMDNEDDAEDPKVADALAQMKAMGFSDDGGWLSSLLKAKSGDVGMFLMPSSQRGNRRRHD